MPSLSLELSATQKHTLKRYGIPFALVIFAGLLRFLWLGLRPVHFDEGVFGYLSDQMKGTGYYLYNLERFHGALLFYILFAFQTLFGRNVWALRFPVAALSTFSVYFVTKFDQFIGKRSAYIAALAMAVSPGAIFFGRYPFHDTGMVLGLLVMIWGFLGLRNEGNVKYLYFFVAGLTSALLFKETSFIHFAAFILAYLCFQILNLIPSIKVINREKAIQSWTWTQFAVTICMSIFVTLFFFTGGFAVPSYFFSFFAGLFPWMKIGIDGQGHEKPFTYWLMLLYTYEIPSLIGMVYALSTCIRRVDGFRRYLSLYALITWLIYSLVPYKTPWCIIALIWPFYFLFGFCLDDILKSGRKRWGYAVGIAALLISFVTTIRINYFEYTNDKEPYSYVQTYHDIEKITLPLLQLIKKDPSKAHIPIYVIIPKSWPLPWILGDFTHVSYYEEFPTSAGFPFNHADVILVSSDKVDELETKLKKPYFTENFQMRPSLETYKAYFSPDIFQNEFEGKTPDFVSKTHSKALDVK